LQFGAMPYIYHRPKGTPPAASLGDTAGDNPAHSTHAPQAQLHHPAAQRKVYGARYVYADEQEKLDTPAKTTAMANLSSKCAGWRPGRTHPALLTISNVRPVSSYPPLANSTGSMSIIRIPVVSVEEANRFLRQEYMAEFNRRFAVAAASKGNAFVRTRRKDLAWVFSIQHERRVNPDNMTDCFVRSVELRSPPWRMAALVKGRDRPLAGAPRVANCPSSDRCGRTLSGSSRGTNAML